MNTVSKYLSYSYYLEGILRLYKYFNMSSFALSIPSSTPLPQLISRDLIDILGWFFGLIPVTSQPNLGEPAIQKKSQTSQKQCGFGVAFVGFGLGFWILNISDLRCFSLCMIFSCTGKFRFSLPPLLGCFVRVLITTINWKRLDDFHMEYMSFFFQA